MERLAREATHPCDLLPDGPFDLTGGQITDLPVQPPLQKYSGFPKTQITFMSPPSGPLGGATRDRRGRGARDAVDAEALLPATGISVILT